MARFLRMDGSSLPARMTLIGGNTLWFKVSGLGPDRKHLRIASSSPVARVSVVSARDGNLEQKLRLDIGEVRTATRAMLTAHAQGGAPDHATQGVEIRLEPALALPPAGDETGMLTRLLLVEAKGPGQPGFVSQSRTLLSMQWMRHVLLNRLKFGPRFFGAGNAGTLAALIVAPNQVEGFEAYPTLTGFPATNLEAIVRIANDGTYSGYASRREFMQNAVDVAKGINPGIDPCPTGLYAWRTERAASPGDNFVKFVTESGTDFYTLTDEFIRDPLLRGKGK
ncbi:MULTISPECIES: hypothetical protein [Cupriavidus]